MQTEPTTVLGTLKPDGALELDEKLELPAGRVRVTVELLPDPTATPDPFLARMEAIWAGQKARGHVPRSEEEVEAERRALREESEDEFAACDASTKNASKPGGKPASEGG